MTKKRALVSVINDLNTDQRVHKICCFIQQQGYDVLLIGRQKKDSLPMEERPYGTKRMKLLFEKGALFYAAFNFRLFWVLLFSKCDVLVSNDLDTLLPNYLVARMLKKKLIYDSHEYFTEVPELIHRPKVKAIWERIERNIFPKLKFVSTVNQSIAKKYTEKYHVDLVVVRNISPLWNAKTISSKTDLGIPENKKILIMQGAGLNVDRGVEEAIAAMEFTQNTVLLIVGDGDVIPAMKRFVAEKQLEEVVLFFGKRPYQELLQYTFHADLGLSFDQPSNPNYQFSLPNKVFDYLHTGTPILCSNVIEVATLVEQYQIGKVITDFRPQQLATIIMKCLKSEALMQTWKQNCSSTANIENWEQEVKKLSVFYPQVHE